ncbi:MAG: thiamine-phosphate kinase [Phycisphaerales bacterium]|nr:thiamine-phosphate kinase [Phycisphaerales bacterium]
MRENDLLHWLMHSTRPDAAVPVPIGDDMAAVAISPQAAGLALLKIDQALDGVHFNLSTCGPAAAGRKAVNRCLSDCAAMATAPAAIMVSVALPADMPLAAAQTLLTACRNAAAEFNCPLVGGDTAIWQHPLVITVSALGFATQSPVLRCGAQLADAIVVSGKLGGSILGRHLTFTPRIKLASLLQTIAPVHSMMDLSDGLAADLPRLAAASGLGAVVDEARLPVHPDATQLAARDGQSPTHHALCDGEDYELLFTLSQHDAARLPTQLADVPLTIIGEMTSEPTLRLRAPDGTLQPWPAGGFEHQGDAH